MLSVTKSLIKLSILLFFSLSVFPQQSNIENPVCNANYSRLLVEQQVSESRSSVEDTDKRIKILIRSADFLWIVDEDTSRKYFAEAFQTAESRFNDKGIESQTKKDLYTYVPDYRFEVIKAITKKDAAWAKKLYEKVLKEYEERSKDDKRDAIYKDRELAELLRIAGENARENPQLTLEIARRVMRYDLIYNWYFQLYQIAGVNQQLADQIYNELLANYSQAEVNRLLYLSAYPFGNPRIFGLERYSMGTELPSNFVPNSNLQYQFLNTLFRKVLNLTPENTNKSSLIGMPETAFALTALNELEPLVTSRFPNLLNSFQNAKTFASSLVTNEILDSIKQQEKWQSGMNIGFEERLKRLEDLDGEGKLKDSDIVSLIINLKTEEQYKKVEFWLLKINDSKAREDTSNLFFFNRSLLALKENRQEEAKKFAGKVNELAHRATLFFKIAEVELKQSKNRFQILDTLDEIYKLAEKAEDSIGKAQVYFGLAFMFAKVDYSRAYDSLNNAIKVTNNLENPDIFQTSIVRQISTKELKYYAAFSTVGFNMEEVFKTLSEKDFSLTLGQAEVFSDKYFKAMAVISTVKDCLKPKTQPGTKTNGKPQ